MGELARIRSTRDLRISRGHVGAASVGVLLVAITAFAAGAASVRGSSAAQPSRGFTAEVPGDALVELIARIDASSLPAGGAEALTYQDDLRGQPGAGFSGAPAPDATKPSRDEVKVGAGTAVVPAIADTPPPGTYTVWVAESADPAEAAALRGKLRQAGHAAWIAATLADGVARYTVAVGGFADAASAQSAAATVRGGQVRTLHAGVVGSGPRARD